MSSRRMVIEMTQAIYKPIYYTWVAVYVTLVLGILIWILGGLVGLPWIWDYHYRAFPSGLLLVFIIMGVVAATVLVTSFTGRRYLGAITASIGTFAAVLILWFLTWILDTWDATTMLMIVIMLAFIVAGLAVLIFARYPSVILTWLVVAVGFTVLIMVWLESTWGTSLLYYLVAVVVVVMYVVVLLMFVLIPKSFLGVSD
jgi:hypothetical protein